MYNKTTALKCVRNPVDEYQYAHSDKYTIIELFKNNLNLLDILGSCTDLHARYVPKYILGTPSNREWITID